jgi:uncharacterized protein DUF4328
MSDAYAVTESSDLFAGMKSATATQGFSWSAKAKPLRGLHRWLQGGLFIYIIGKVLLTFSIGIMLWMFGVIASGEDFTGPGLEFLGMAAGVTAQASPFIQIGSYLICVFLYLRFVYRAMKNLHLSNAWGLSTSPAWAVGWSFIPFANLGMIFSVMKQIWVGSADPGKGSREAPMTLGWWWGLFIAGNLIGAISDRLTPANPESIYPEDIYSQFAPALITSIVSSALLIASTLLLMRIVRQVTQAQEALSSISVFDE